MVSFSSNVNEVIKTILDFFIQKFYKHKAQNANKQTRIKNALKNIWGEKSPSFAYLLLWFCSFAGLCLCAFGAFCAKSFRKKEFKTALIASFMLLLVWFYQTVVKFVCFIFTFFFGNYFQQIFFCILQIIVNIIYTSFVAFAF